MNQNGRPEYLFYTVIAVLIRIAAIFLWQVDWRNLPIPELYKHFFWFYVIINFAMIVKYRYKNIVKIGRSSSPRSRIVIAMP